MGIVQVMEVSQNAIVMLAMICVITLGFVFIFVATGLVEKHNDNRKREAFAYLINRTRGFYFYGYPLSDVLKAGVACELHERGVGDFEKELALLTMAALTINADYEDVDTVAVVMATRNYDKKAWPHNEATVCFRDRHGWWIFGLSGGVVFRALEPLGREYKSFAWMLAKKPTSCQELSDKQTEELLLCRKSEMSKLQPTAFYRGSNMTAAQETIDRMMRVHNANREKIEALYQ